MTCYLGLVLYDNPHPSPQGLHRREALPGRRISLCFGLSSLLSCFYPFGSDGLCAKGKSHGGEDPALAGGGSLQAPPAHEKTLEVFSLGLPQAFPFERAELA